MFSGYFICVQKINFRLQRWQGFEAAVGAIGIQIPNRQDEAVLDNRHFCSSNLCLPKFILKEDPYRMYIYIYISQLGIASFISPERPWSWIFSSAATCEDYPDLASCVCWRFWGTWTGLTNCWLSACQPCFVVDKVVSSWSLPMLQSAPECMKKPRLSGFCMITLRDNYSYNKWHGFMCL